MKPTIKKTGDAYIHIGIVRTKSLAKLVPKNTTVHTIFPGLSFYAVGIFNYTDIIDLEPGNKAYRWKGDDDLFDILVQFPVDYYNMKNLYYVHRLYNSNPVVVKWAKGYHLNKIPVKTSWETENKNFSMKLDKQSGGREHIGLKGRKIMGLPGFIWKIKPLSSLVRAFLLFEDEAKTYTFEVIMKFKKSYLGTSKLITKNLGLPKPLISFTFCIKGFNLNIFTFQKIFHPCKYGEDLKGKTPAPRSVKKNA